MGMLLPLVLFIAIFYFLIIRPQKKRQREHDQLLASISRGDPVITAGGMFGVVRDIKDDSFIIEIADGVKVRMLKGSISTKRVSPEEERARKAKKETKAGNKPSVLDESSPDSDAEIKAVPEEPSSSSEENQEKPSGNVE